MYKILYRSVGTEVIVMSKTIKLEDYKYVRIGGNSLNDELFNSLNKLKRDSSAFLSCTLKLRYSTKFDTNFLQITIKLAGERVNFKF